MKILFICTHNRCRSILAEAITNHLSNGKIKAYSAGSQPSGEVHPLSIKYLQAHGIETANCQSQSWDDLESIEPDAVITVCDSAASEVCPVWFGQSVKAHWGLPDPSKLNASEDEVTQAFNDVIETLKLRIKKLLSFDGNKLNQANLKQTLIEIAEAD